MSEQSAAHKKVSKFLSYILRHKPSEIDVNMDAQGWVSVAELIEKTPAHYRLDRPRLAEVVALNDKQRFKLSDDGEYIRANQGHTLKIELDLEPHAPPAVLYHGTATRFLESIMQQGLKPGLRHHVHLSADIATAKAVGQRYGKVVILEVAAATMRARGHRFYLSENGVWLVDHVPVEFLSER